MKFKKIRCLGIGLLSLIPIVSTVSAASNKAGKGQLEKALSGNNEFENLLKFAKENKKIVLNNQELNLLKKQEV